ncbi:MAG: hypothetical protein A3E01_09920 [Gammaproteobacteria bacterium RIFCSPHIGHO2_12_FULL_63_22]|nr:MAG: hypothetical protein A3E01_09920 [Gammaproteobacteria bacterium RIFCSPHIGHO2_12_FULL_63_22]
MKTPWYETSAGATAALLLSGAWVDCDLYTITTPSGTVLRYATGDLNVDVSGTIYYCNLALVDLAGRTPRGHWKVGTGVDTWQWMMAPRAVDPATGTANPDTINSLPWTEAILKGALDGADVQVDRAIFSAWPAQLASKAFPTGVFTLFKGFMGACDVGDSAVAFTAISYMDLLSSNSPRNVWQAGCRWTLFDAGCGLSAAAWDQSSTVQSGSTPLVINTSLSPLSGSTFPLGRILFTGGQNNGFARGIRSFSGGALTLTAPLFWPVNTGDGFTIFPGCDKTTTACSAFSNLANFGGQPYIPKATTAL